MISVVIPTLISTNDQFIMTKKCIAFAKTKSKLPFELVIVETDTNYLSDFADIYIREKEITNATKSINRGFKNCSGSKVVLLTNDVFVDNYWLECLLACFDKKDCGLATLATNQFNHVKQDKIEEGIWFSLAMMNKQDAQFDEKYVNSWDDSDLIMNIYKRGFKMYRNFNCVVQHDPGKTQYKKLDHTSNFIKNREYFKKKWEEDKDSRMYKVFTEGIVV